MRHVRNHIPENSLKTSWQMFKCNFMDMQIFIGRIMAVSFPLGLLLLSGCNKPIDNSKRLNAIDLYVKSVSLITNYTDSFKGATDSATLLELNDNFSSALSALNFKYPSETCLDISEGENDTLTNLTEKIISIRDSLLYLYAHPLVTDSTLTDSIPHDKISIENKGRRKK